ncbi:family 20 glycosylhydrolase [Streptacidiphilus neutrinimicus]|uniref:family 20 glycosylhydrolase n=1 Tax=Streptacidiphilus neutrinimicus TaxID=105420 RepID=UPI0005A7F23E|nr:family 20 glycosylhydrolase [Streptacidiphilus neutrinimicus]
MNRSRRRPAGRTVAAAALTAVLALVTGCSSGSAPPGRAAASRSGRAPGASAPAVGIVPRPARLTLGAGAGFDVSAATPVHAEGGPDAHAAATLVAAELKLRTQGGSGAGITFRLDPKAGTGPEGYRLSSGPSGVLITASDAAGLFYGGQTLRQLLPAGGVYGTVRPLAVDDAPRYAYRGAGLDVARHFLTVAQVEQYVDLMALYKLNHLHLHLTDDQGWRIAVSSRPQLTAVGSRTEVGGGRGGFYTAADYSAIVRYAAARYITVVPEIDLPGHSNAAIVSYPELACPGDATPAPDTGTGVGFSRVCTGEESTYRFVDDVVAAVAQLTPGPLIHLGGDEAKALAPADYQAFMKRAIAVGRAHGKQVLAWDEAAAEQPDLLQVWHPERRSTAEVLAGIAAAARHGSKLLMSPADRAYLDQKYDPSTPLGLAWAGYVGVERAYDWNPDTYLPGTPPGAVAGVEAVLWTETLATPSDLQLMALPRLPALAEVAWTPQTERGWADFRVRLAAQAPLWRAQGWTWTRAAGVPWQ